MSFPTITSPELFWCFSGRAQNGAQKMRYDLVVSKRGGAPSAALCTGRRHVSSDEANLFVPQSGAQKRAYGGHTATTDQSQELPLQQAHRRCPQSRYPWYAKR
jgi:hypothetical protein